jgi:hypothetical protein
MGFEWLQNRGNPIPHIIAWQPTALRRLNVNVMPEYPESAKNNHADHLDVFWDHHPNVFRRS